MTRNGTTQSAGARTQRQWNDDLRLCAAIFRENSTEYKVMSEARSLLSRAATELRKLANSHALGAEMDAGFDAGEFSGPAHADAEADEQRVIARRYGFSTVSALYKAIEDRTSARWVHFNMPPVMGEEDEFEHDSVHGRAANV